MLWSICPDVESAPHFGIGITEYNGRRLQVAKYLSHHRVTKYVNTLTYSSRHHTLTNSSPRFTFSP
eukprot:105802-Amorphochlora_amoeboformis.AAC.1